MKNNVDFLIFINELLKAGVISTYNFKEYNKSSSNSKAYIYDFKNAEEYNRIKIILMKIQELSSDKLELKFIFDIEDEIKLLVLNKRGII